MENAIVLQYHISADDFTRAGLEKSRCWCTACERQQNDSWR